MYVVEQATLSWVAVLLLFGVNLIFKKGNRLSAPFHFLLCRQVTVGMVIAMENKYIIQAFQEALADLPPEEQALKVLQFTERMQELEAADLRRNAHSGVSQGTEGPVGPGTHGGSDEVKNGRKSGGVQRSPEGPAEPIRSKTLSGARSGNRSGSNLPPGWEGVGEQEADKDYDMGRNGRRSGGKRLQEDTSKKVSLPVLMGICAGALCLIAVIVVVVAVLRAGGGKPDEPNGPDKFESGNIGPIETEGENTDDPGISSTPGGGESDQKPEATPGGETDQKPEVTSGGDGETG